MAAVIGACAALAAGLTTASVASAANTPTVAQAQAKVNLYTSEYNQANQQYDAVETQLTAAKQRQMQLEKQLTADQKLFKAAHAAVAQIAATTYEDSGSTSLAGLLTANNPTQVLNQASMLLELAGSRNEQTRAYLADAQQLANVQQEQQRTESGIQTLADQKSAAKNRAEKSRQQAQTTLDSLTQQQQTQISTIGTGGTTSGGGGYTGPTSTQADKAVQFAYDQIGCTYYYGGTGPCHSPGFDCSGLVMQAWAYAGVTIPRDTYEQYAALPHVSLSSLQPGDLVYFNSIGHVGMYVGGGYIIDAPTEGIPVEKVSMSESWYAQNVDGAARP